MLGLLINNWSNVYFIAQSSSNNSGGGLGGIIYLIFVIGGYIFGSYCFQRIYEKLGEPNAWFAWIPLLNNWIMYKAGDQSPWWIIGLFVPFVNIIASIILIIAFINIVKKIDKNPWLIILMMIPLVNFWVLYNFAF